MSAVFGDFVAYVVCPGLVFAIGRFLFRGDAWRGRHKFVVCAAPVWLIAVAVIATIEKA